MDRGIETVKTFMASLKGGAAARGDLLTEDAGFMALVKLKGRDAVLGRMTAADTGRVYREAAWSEPEREGERVRLAGRLPAGDPMGGAILTIGFAGERIALIQHQPLPGTPMPASAVKLPPELKKLVDNALASRHPMLIAYVEEGGQPVVSFRGSTQAFSDDQLGLWIRNAGGSFIASIGKNPKVALMYRDEDSKETFQFQGRARVTTDEAARRKIYESAAEAERNHDYARTGVAVIVDLDLIEGWFGLTPEGPINRVRMVRGR